MVRLWLNYCGGSYHDVWIVVGILLWGYGEEVDVVLLLLLSILIIVWHQVIRI